ncbi:MAG: precorrin-6Y C5,15-methyltransferase (decarboxylating) subunit CbiT [Firmicutes bacterium]|nr:precorrin-6Y C5,15-methyltransferase (decarboxylating) subunit CbiT [Bacillota bacterium]
MSKRWPYAVPGIPDDEFIRGKVPMTKREIRILTMAQLRLQQQQVVWDVGAGTGSLSVEAALITTGGKVYAIERNEAGIALIAENCQRFGVENITIVAGEAPAALRTLPTPQRIIVGGSGGQLAEILAHCGQRLAPGGFIVVNVLSPRNLVRTLQVLSNAPFCNRAGMYIQSAQLEKLGREDYFRAQNGVWIMSAQKEA